MTRAKEELLLTSAGDYGTARIRKLSRFVVEALDLPSPAPAPRKSLAVEALARHQPAPEPRPGVEGPMREDEVLHLSFRQMDDYETCPLKYKYVHRLRVPLLVHHRVVYGSAIHKAVQELFRARLQGRPFGEDEVVASVAFVDIACGEMHPNRSWRHLLKFLNRQVGKVPEQPARVV